VEIKRKRKVAVIYKYVPEYRFDFFNLARERLAEEDIEFLLLYGQPGRFDAQKGDSVELPWATKISSVIWVIGKWELYWQPVLEYLHDVDLVIVEQANKLLVNYVLQAQNLLGIRKLAFWGHGRNLQAKKVDTLSEWIKRKLSTKAHWWFAYDDVSARYVESLGYPHDRITSVQNAIDTRFLSRAYQSLTSADISRVCQQLDIRSQYVCIYAGGMYPDKRLSFLLDSLNLIRKQIPDFEMILIGSGVDARLVEDFAGLHSWVHYIGPKFKLRKIPYFAISKLLLNPGVVGLGILDSFALETPLITTNIPNHGPEIEYLENGINGIMVQESRNPQAYANAVIDLLNDESGRQRLIENCRKAREKYTVENMVENFLNGIEKALEE
jgi:glycosyltransferase involved in cell wall biosynthesis